MTTITEAQRVALEKAVDVLWDKAEESDYYYDEPYYVIRDLLDNAIIEADDASPLWRDRPREDWMLDGEIHLELVADPYVTVAIDPAWIDRGTSLMVEDYDDETVTVSPEHLPALIAMLQEVQRRIEAGDAL